jgi:hypothetical protein
MGSQQVIKLLVRSFRRLRLFFCGLLTRPTAPRHAPQTAKFPSNPRSAPEELVNTTRLVSGVYHINFNWLTLAQ